MLTLLAFRWLDCKSSVAPTKLCFFGTLIKNVHAVGFSEKPDFLERVCFHRAMLCVTNFRIVLGVCIVHVVIFIKKYV